MNERMGDDRRLHPVRHRWQPDRHVDAAMNDEQGYYLSNYGSCRLEKCQCAAEGLWRGILCEHWEPVGATCPEELILMMKERYRQTKEICGND